MTTESEATAEAAPETGKVFLSYSRKDRERAQGIADALRSRHFGVFKDTDDILPTEEWKTRLEALIAEADTIVFLLSPHSARSEVCAWEVDYAAALNKRIAPIVIEDTEAAEIPPRLAQLNFIFCTPRDPFDNAVDTLASALSTDIEWIREHTRLAGLAARWDGAERPARLLLRGQDIADAEAWRDGRPEEAPAVTALQTAFVGESRRAAARRQRGWIAGAFAVTAGALALAVFAWLQSVEADRQRVEAEAQRDAALRSESLFLATGADRLRAEGRAAEALSLALRGLPREGVARPLSPAALRSLREARAELRTRANFAADVSAPSSAVFTPDGARLVVAGSYGDIVAYDATTGAVLWKATALEDERGHGVALAMLDDGETLLTGGVDGRLRWWRMADGALVREETGLLETVDRIAVAPGSGRIAAFAFDGSSVVLDAAGAPVFRTPGDRYSVNEIAFSDDGSVLAALHDGGRLALWSAEGAELGGEDMADSVSAFAFRPGAAEIMISRFDGRLEALTLPTLSPREGFQTEFGAAAAAIRYHPAGHVAALVMSGLPAVPVIAADTGEARGRDIVLPAEVRDAAFLSDRWLAVAAEDGAVRFVDTRWGMALAEVGGFDDGAWRIVSTPAADHVAVFSWGAGARLLSGPLVDGVPVYEAGEDAVFLISTSAERPAATFVTGSGLRGLRLDDGAVLADSPLDPPVDAAAASPGFERIAIADTAPLAVTLIDFAKGPPPLFARHESNLTALAVSPTEAAVAYTDGEGVLRILREGGTVEVPGFGAPRFLGFAPGGDALWVADLNELIEVDPATGAERRRLDIGFGESVFALSPDGARFARASDEDEVTVFALADGARLARIPTPGLRPRRLAFSANGARLAAAAGREVHLFDAASGALEQRFFDLPVDSVTAMAFTPDGTALIVGGSGGRATILTIATQADALIAEAELLDRRLVPLSTDLLCEFNQAKAHDCAR